MLTLTKSGASFSGSQRDLDELAGKFAKHHYLRLPGFLDPRLYQAVTERIERAQFQPRVHDHIVGSEFTMSDPVTSDLLSFLMNGTRLFDLVERLTGCPAIGSFQGRVYRLAPHAGQQLHWHNDIENHRLIALSLNLSAQPYAGGRLQIRYPGSVEHLAEVANTEPNCALLFQVSEELEHRVTAVEGENSKTSYSGWFASQPDLRERLTRAIGA